MPLVVNSIVESYKAYLSEEYENGRAKVRKSDDRSPRTRVPWK